MAALESPPIEGHLRAAERRMIELLALRPRALPPALAVATGRWKDVPVTIATRAYEGDAVGILRVAVISGLQITIGSILALPRPNRPAPLLRAELSWSGGREETTVTADLLPVRDSLEREAELAAIARLAPNVSSLPSAGEATGVHAEWRSPSALYTRVPRGGVGHALQAFDGYVTAFTKLLGATSPSAERAYQVRAIHEGFLLAHRSDDSVKILGTMFGRAWAEEYLVKVLFPLR